jgi:hypothetical protein
MAGLTSGNLKKLSKKDNSARLSENEINFLYYDFPWKIFRYLADNLEK